MPNYKKIFEDIISKNCPERMDEFKQVLNKEKLSAIDIVSINTKIFSAKDKETLVFNQKHKSYDEETILQILAYQKKEKLNNIQLASHYNLSRNTVTKWRKLYKTSC